MHLYFALIIVLITHYGHGSSQSDEYYLGAIVEYHPIPKGNDKVSQHMLKNIEEYKTLTEQAKQQGADIIVFPEYGITTTSIQSAVRAYTTVIPDPETKTVACNNTTYSGILQRLSCIAKNNTIYLVVNLPERVETPNSNKSYIAYNANIVFDRTGALIARYRKTNLFEEPYFEAPEKPDVTTFETDFGVTFGTFTCFDILFPEPGLELLRKKNVTNFVFPTAWFSELPFLTAVQTQNGWAQANGVNLLAADYNDPENCAGGSGVYQANGDLNYTVPIENKSKLIVRKIRKVRLAETSNSNSVVDFGSDKTVVENLKLNVLKENMTKYESYLLTQKQESIKKCHQNLCCNFNVKFNTAIPEGSYYRLFVYDGMRPMGNINGSVQICGVTACKDQTVESCGDRLSTPSNPVVFDEISISGDFLDKGKSVIFPSQLLYNLGILPRSSYSFKSEKTTDSQKIVMSTTTPVKDVLAFGIYSVTKDSHSSHDGTSSLLIFLYIALGCVGILAVAGIIIYLLRAKNSHSFTSLFRENNS